LGHARRTYTDDVDMLGKFSRQAVGLSCADQGEIGPPLVMEHMEDSVEQFFGNGHGHVYLRQQETHFTRR